MGDDGGMKSAFCDCTHPLLLSLELRLCVVGWFWFGFVVFFSVLFCEVFRAGWAVCPLLSPRASFFALARAGGGRSELCPLASALTPTDFDGVRV